MHIPRSKLLCCLCVQLAWLRCSLLTSAATATSSSLVSGEHAANVHVRHCASAQGRVQPCRSVNDTDSKPEGKGQSLQLVAYTFTALLVILVPWLLPCAVTVWSRNALVQP